MVEGSFMCVRVCAFAPLLAMLDLAGYTPSQIGVHVSEVIHKRFGRTILELGGNNSTIGARWLRAPGVWSFIGSG